jgi:Na+-driven multidrug efflux pump
MLLAAALPLIFTELTSIVAVFIDGITASRFLGTEVYSGIALLKD